MRGYLIILFIIFSLKPVSSQIIGNLPIDQSLYAIENRVMDFPQNKNKQFGIGNYGFDTFDGYYNPHSLSWNKKLYIRISEFYSKSYRDYIVRGGSNIISQNGKLSFPNFSISFKANPINLNLIYLTEMFLSYSMNETSLLYFSTTNGPYSYLLIPTFFSKNDILQLSASYDIIKNSSISIGILTNNYLYEVGEKGKINFHFSSSFFNNYQFLGSLNFNFNNKFYTYLFLKSQSSLNSMKRSVSGFDQEIMWGHKGIVSFPGEIGYGVQYPIKQFALSLELHHEYLFFNNKVIDGKEYKDIFNTEIIAGANIHLFNSFLFGMLISYYSKYDTRIRYQIPRSYDEYIKKGNPFIFNFSGRYLISNVFLDFSYQYSMAEYILDKKDKLTAIRDSAHFFKIGLGFLL